MSACPNCSAAIPDTSFGIYTCEECGTVLSVDMDGNAELATDSPQEEYRNDSPIVPSAEEPYTLEIEPQVVASADLTDLSDFANASENSGEAGNLLYDVLIAGIDSEEMRQTLSDSLRDKRFGWDADLIIKKIKAGTLKLEKLNAVKASVLVSRLKAYPFEISWIQVDVL